MKITTCTAHNIELTVKLTIMRNFLYQFRCWQITGKLVCMPVTPANSNFHKISGKSGKVQRYIFRIQDYDH